MTIKVVYSAGGLKCYDIDGYMFHEAGEARFFTPSEMAAIQHNWFMLLTAAAVHSRG